LATLLNTEEKAAELRKQALDMGIDPSRKKKVVHLTSVF